MSYSVFIRNNATGEWREAKQALPWNGDATGEFWWTEGNMGCDCNRASEFASAGGQGRPAETPCGDTRFHVSHALLPDGRRVELDGEPYPEDAPQLTPGD